MGTPAALPAVEPPVELEAVSCCDLKSEFELVYLLPQMLARLLSQTMRTMTHYQQPNDKEPVHPKHPRTALVMECIAWLQTCLQCLHVQVWPVLFVVFVFHQWFFPMSECWLGPRM